MKKVIVALALALFASGAYAGDFPDISIGELKDAINARKVAVIDVNGRDTWTQGHIPGAIEFGASKGNLAALLPKNKDALVVAYCGGPSCGAYAAAAKAAKARDADIAAKAAADAQAANADLKVQADALQQKVNAYEEQLKTRPSGNCPLTDDDIGRLRSIK